MDCDIKFAQLYYIEQKNKIQNQIRNAQKLQVRIKCRPPIAIFVNILCKGVINRFFHAPLSENNYFKKNKAHGCTLITNCAKI